MNEIPNRPCHDGAPKLTEETVLVSPDGGLKNVLVTIEGIGPGTVPAIAKGEPPMLDQVHCRYVPHLIGLTVGQELTIRSSDATLHNVHIADLMNFGLTSRGAEKKVSFKTPGLLAVKCDVHPWMSAYIAVFENPFFAITGEDGTFEIKNVPAGSWKLNTWHEQYGRLEQSVACRDDMPAEVKLTYGK